MINEWGRPAAHRQHHITYTQTMNPLFEPLKIGSLELTNRVVMAPMTRSFSPGGLPTPDVASYYQRRAVGEVGLVLTEGTVVDRPLSSSDPAVPRFHGDALPAWSRVVESVHQAGGRIAPQLWHVGAARGRGESFDADLVDSPSGLARPGAPLGKPMSEEAIADTISAFGKAARAAIALGFDAVELHGAHGYLIDQFLWAGTNQRQDGWGGASIRERARFAAAVVRAARAEMSADVPLIFRLSQWKQQDYKVKLAATPAELSDLLEPLAEAGVDVFHCSQRRFWEPEFEGSGLNLAGWAKKLTGKVSITVGSVGLEGDFFAAFKGDGAGPASLDGLIERLEREEFDLVAVGRALLTDPAWLQKVRQGAFDELKGFDGASLARLY